jgi:cytochrome c heme-lyase
MSSCPVQHDENACPMNSNASEMQPNSLNLSKERVTSSIPMATKNQNWIYPSEQMFFDAMKRKNKNPQERDMHTIIPIHNAVNEQVWSEILKWESLLKNNCQPKLFKFEGKAKDFTLKARIYNFLGYSLPFDRHDWVLDRCGEKVKYIIDFYSAEPVEGKPIAFYLDVRRDLSFDGLKHRIMFWFKNKIN